MVSRKNVLKYYQVYDLPISYYSENPNVLFLTDNDGNDHKLVGISDLQFEELLEKSVKENRNLLLEMAMMKNERND